MVAFTEVRQLKNVLAQILRESAATSCALLAMTLVFENAAVAGTVTANMTVQITITASCTVNAATLDFGSNVPGTTLVSSAVNGSTTVSVTCTNGSPYSIGMDNGANASGSQRRMRLGASSNYLNYNLYTDAARLNAWTTASSNSTCTTSNSCYLGTGTGGGNP